jgi:hypothetical protein
MLALLKSWEAIDKMQNLGPRPAAPPSEAAPPPVWHYSSFELMNGLDVAEFSEAVSGEVFRELFRR